MNIFNHFSHIKLSNDQANAVQELHDFLQNEERVFILKGYAGSGKTTLLEGLVKYLNWLQKDYQLMAPTGRAAKIIQQKTGIESTTIHKGIYSFEQLHEIKQGEDENQQGKDSINVSFLYQFKIRNNPEVYNSVLIVDEASMVSDVLSQGEFFRFGSGCLLKDLLSYGRIRETGTSSKIIFVGDPAQLPPVGMNFSPALNAKYLNETYQLSAEQVEMKEVKRQGADNGILQTASKIRKCLTSGYFNNFDLSANNRDVFNLSYNEYLDSYKAQQGRKIIICYKNKTARDLNHGIRKDRFGENLSIQSSDTVIINANNYLYGIMNGEFAVVSEVSTSVVTRDVSFYIKGGEIKKVNLTWRRIGLVIQDDNSQDRTLNGYILENYVNGDNYLTSDEQRALYVDFKKRHSNLKKDTAEFKEAILNDEFFNCILLKYGYAVTCHKAQGGEWDNTFVFWDRGIPSNSSFYESKQKSTGRTNSAFYRWAYTAITRASQKMYCINPPNFSSFSKMTFVDIEVQQALNVLSGQQDSDSVVNLNEVLPLLERFGLIDAPLTIQNHLIHKWFILQKQDIIIESWNKLGYEIRYKFKKEGQTAAIKYWVNGKHVFKSNFQKLPAQTNSDEFFETISDLLENALPIEVIRDNTVSSVTPYMFDERVEEEKPFLKYLFDSICHGLADDGVVSDIQHLPYRERYTIEQHGESCIFDFEYNNAGFFGRVLPLKNKCKNSKLPSIIKDIVLKLKEEDYVI